MQRKMGTRWILGCFCAMWCVCVEAQDENRIPAKGLAVLSKGDAFQPYEFTRHAVGEKDILLEILYVGLCHTDIHAVREDFGKSHYPMVPGHEIVGQVIEIGKEVTKFQMGDYVGVGCMVNACRECSSCRDHQEQFCRKGTIYTYNSVDVYHHHEITQGGYATNLVVSEAFALKIPKNADLKRVAPLLCAGITTYSPIRFSQVQKGDRVGVAGFGGVGHMAVQYAAKLGAEVIVFDITEEKRADALRLGAKRYVNVLEEKNLAELDDSFDFLLSTVSANYDPMMYVRMLKRGGEMAIVGLPSHTEINIVSLVTQANRKIYGSLIGGIQETQEMLDFSIANGIYPEVEMIPATPESLEQAYQNILAGKVKFRYVMDMKTMKQ
ncbi:MAG: NAD(P)-dependent alcohol dehydrogenase [Planctomycetia bacterium]|nr:NAD(P)-dependent alcohol dehydrogenase [Planctomycetia bacterium]